MPASVELEEAVRAAAMAQAPPAERAQRGRHRPSLGGRVRGLGNEVVNLAWSGPGPAAHPRFPVERGPTGAAIGARETVGSTDVARDRATSLRSRPPAPS